jgi:uncharacterized Zn-finger protein
MAHPKERPKKRPRTWAKTVEDVLTHDHKPNRSRGMICDLCRKKFFKKHTLEFHMKQHIRSFYKIPCTFCQRRFASQASMLHHRNIVHEKETASYYCHDCDKSYDLYQPYLRHCSSVKHLSKKDHVKNWKVYVSKQQEHNCLVCDRKFANQETYKRHMLLKHTDGDQEGLVKRLVESFIDFLKFEFIFWAKIFEQ